MLISAGATVPPAHEGKRYCFNIVTFQWDEQNQNLMVRIEPREWDRNTTRFKAGTVAIGGQASEYSLKCPNYLDPAAVLVGPLGVATEATLQVPAMKIPSIADDEEYSLLVLTFFRDIEESERIKILGALNIIPKAWTGTLTHSMERRFLDMARQAGKMKEIKSALSAHSHE